MDRIKVLLLLVASYVVGLLFDLIPFAPASPQQLFPLFDGRSVGMTLEYYAYFCGEHLSRMAIWYAFFLATGWQIINRLFLIEFMDIVDFMMIYNRPWFDPTQEVGFEFNHVKLCLISYFVISDVWTHRQSFGYSV